MMGVALVAVALLPRIAAAGSLVCDRPDFQFGVVEATTGIVSHVFELRNEGQQPLVLDEVASPCGCIAIRLQTNLLAGGESTRLPVTLDLRRRNGAQRLAAHVCYHTRGLEDASILSLSMHGTVVGTNTATVATSNFVGNIVGSFVDQVPDKALGNDAAQKHRIAPRNDPTNAGTRRVVVEVFGEAGCEACATVHQEVLPAVKQQFGDRIAIVDRDVYETTNFVMLATYQERLGVSMGRRNDPVSVVVDGCRYLGGVAEIRRELPKVLRERLAAEEAAVLAEGDREAVPARFARFTLPLVLAAGFLDGINHCAITTVIFLVSLLSVSKVRGGAYLRLGIAFCLASFLTYFLVGLGLLEGMHRLAGFRLLRTILNAVVAGAALIFAWLSFRDAWRYRRSGDAHDVTLQLPLAVKKAIHAAMRRGIGGGSLVLGGLAAGVAVTLLEGICTGQVYVPTLAMIARTQEHSGRALRYLLAYNVASDVPQVAVLVLGYIGIRTDALLTFSRRNVLLSKVLAGCFFVALAALMLAA